MGALTTRRAGGRGSDSTHVTNALPIEITAIEITIAITAENEITVEITVEITAAHAPEVL